MWTYEPSLNEYDKEVTQDTSTPGRWTFKRYMYFKPDTYNEWSTGQNTSNKNFSFDLLTNNNFPRLNDPCPDNVNFYVSAIVSIKNLSSEAHGEHSSYCQITVEYENKPKKKSGGGGGNPNKTKPPWERPVEDFTVVSQEMTKPLTYAYKNNQLVVPATTAGQPYYDLNDVYYIQRATWTYASKSGNFSIRYPRINDNDVTLFNHVVIPEGAGLLLPPGYKRLYWAEAGDDIGQAYDEWTFEILIDTTYSHNLNILNAGTKFLKNNNLVDICSWYVYDPNSTDPPQKMFGSYDEMMNARSQVYQRNQSIKDESKKLQWFGDFLQNPVPISLNGGIDIPAINDPSKTIKNQYRVYDVGNWNIGVR
jgi:hypothetical protein